MASPVLGVCRPMSGTSIYLRVRYVTSAIANSGTDMASGATSGPCQRACFDPAIPHDRVRGATGLGASYAMPGTDIVYHDDAVGCCAMHVLTYQIVLSA
eukprot:1904368-Rhodomonas_salina.1